MSSDLAFGITEEIKISSIIDPSFKLRTSVEFADLALSIMNKGLLQPIIVRPKDGKFELVAGSRRIAACRSLGWRKVTCHLMELTDRETFEVALTENVTRRTLDPIDEAKAFDTYVKKYGWGSEADLAKKIGKSRSYISRRLALLSLPPDQIEKIFRRRKNPSLAEELITIEDVETRSDLIDLSSACELSSKEIRRIAKDLRHSNSDWTGLQTYRNEEERKYRMMRNAIRRSVVALRVALFRIDEVIDNISEQDWILRQILMEQRQALHSQIDLVGNLTKRLEKLSTTKGD